MDSKVSVQTKALLIAYKAQFICLKGIQADIQRRIESVQREMDEVMEIIRKKENKPEQSAEKAGASDG